MELGVCCDPTMAKIIKNAGFDYFEWSVGGLLHPREEEAIFEKALHQALAVGLPFPVLNVFIPADLKITGPDTNLFALETYVETALRRAQIAGVETIVFGSGGARQIPDGFNRDQAWKQLLNFCNILGSIAQSHHITIAVEHLNLAESNILNTVSETAELVRQVNHPHIRLLVDGYHWSKDGDTISGILDNADLIIHAHVASKFDRKPPHIDDTCNDFLSALKQSGYLGRISVEARIIEPETELPQALKILRNFQ